MTFRVHLNKYREKELFKVWSHHFQANKSYFLLLGVIVCLRLNQGLKAEALSICKRNLLRWFRHWDASWSSFHLRIFRQVTHTTFFHCKAWSKLAWLYFTSALAVFILTSYLFNWFLLSLKCTSHRDPSLWSRGTISTDPVKHGTPYCTCSVLHVCLHHAQCCLCRLHCMLNLVIWITAFDEWINGLRLYHIKLNESSLCVWT